MKTALTLHAADGTDPGRVHTLNQDSALSYVRPADQGEAIGLFIVADGMGGHKAGEVASKLAVDTVYRELQWLLEKDDAEDTQPSLSNPTAPTLVDQSPATRLQRKLVLAIHEANKAITAHAQENPDDAGNLGTTITCALVRNNRTVVANVGDSRTYLLRNGQLRQLTQDHSYVARLVREGQIEPEDVFSHPRRNVITRSLGHRPEIEVDAKIHKLHPGDQLLLCSDGLWEMVRDETVMAQHLLDARLPGQAVNTLIDAANQNGGADNIGVVVVHVSANSM